MGNTQVQSLDNSGIFYIRELYIDFIVLVEDEDIHMDPEWDLYLVWEGIEEEDKVPTYRETRTGISFFTISSYWQGGRTRSW